MPITFAVDDVAPATARLREVRVPLASIALAPPLGASHDEVTLVATGVPETRAFGGPPEDRLNALAQAVDLAFNDHRPLRLTPDAVWITLAQGFAIHVRENAEQLRERFVRHAGQRTLSVEVDAVPRGAEWRELINAFSEATAEHLGPGVVALLTRPFSTTSPDARAVFQIALMETFASYFEYEMVCICGIPEITLEGSSEDWRDIRRRVEVMGEYDLRWWTDQLLPICDQWIATAEGRPDVSFWRAIHRPESVYGGHLITGWLARLFPYVEGGANRWVPNELAPARRIKEDAIKPATVIDGFMRAELRRNAARAGVGEVIPWAHVGVSPRSLPASWSQATVRGGGLAEGQSYRVSGGLLGVRQAHDGLALEPAVAWLAEPAQDDATFRALEAHHALVAAEPVDRSRQASRSELGDTVLRGALLEFYRRYDRATLFGGLLALLPRYDDGAGVAREFAGGDDADTLNAMYLWTFARVSERGALAWLGHRPPGGREVGVLDISRALPHRLDWIVYVPDAQNVALAECVVIALDGWSFFRALAEHPSAPYFLAPDAQLPGRLLDLFRDPPLPPAGAVRQSPES